MKDINRSIRISSEDSKKFTQAALSMLTCCMQKVSGEMISAEGSRATTSYFDKMAGIVMGLGETIYRIENDKIECDSFNNNDSDDFMITLTPDN